MSVSGGGLTGEGSGFERPRQFVVAAIRNALGLRDRMLGRHNLSLAASEEDAVAAIAMRNKIGGLVRTGAQCASLNMSAKLDEMLKAQQSQAVAKNLVNLVETDKVLRLLGKHVAVLVIKGPVRSFELFGNLDRRISNDIDILVSPEHYQVAGEILCQNGYRRGVPCDDHWWHDHLGESPFLPDNGHCTVDVHHKVQQPGGPSPRDLASFLESARDITVANRTFKVLGTFQALLLSYISASKALRSEEFWLGYAAEIAVSRARMSTCEVEEFQVIAAQQGLSRLVNHVDCVVDRIMAQSADDLRGQLPDKDLAALAAFPFGDGKSAGRRLHRSRLLWAWADGAGVRRAANFTKHTLELMMSDMRRVRESEV